MTLFMTLFILGTLSAPIHLATFPTPLACTAQLEVVKTGMELAYPGEAFTFFCR